MKRSGNFNEPSKKRHKPTFKLSKTSKVVAVSMGGKKFNNDVKRVAQIVGRFCGTDVNFAPGDLFVREVIFGDPGIVIQRSVLLTDRRAGHGLIRWFRGARFHVHRVLSVTPCTMTVELMRSYHAYGRIRHLPNGGLDQEHQGFREFLINDLHGLFEITHEPGWNTFKVRPNMHKNSETMEKFNQLDLTTAVKIDFAYQVMYDYDNDELKVMNPQ